MSLVSPRRGAPRLFPRDSARRISPGGVMRLLATLWLAASFALVLLMARDTARFAVHDAGRSVDAIRARMHGNRWGFYRALTALPEKSIILVPGTSDEIYYYASYFAYPRFVIRDPAAVPGAWNDRHASFPRYEAHFNGKTGEYVIRAPGTGATVEGVPGAAATAPGEVRPGAARAILGSLFAAASVYLLGWLFIATILPAYATGSWTSALALSYPAGALLLALLLFIEGLIPGGMGLARSAPLWYLLLLALAISRRGARHRMPPARMPGATPATEAGFGFRFIPTSLLRVLLAGSLVVIAATALVEPVGKWDAIAMWSQKAQVLFHERSLVGPSFRDPPVAALHPDYPLIVPGLEAWDYFIMGGKDDWAAKLMLVPFLFSLAALLFEHGRSIGGVRFGIGLALIGITIPAAVVRWTAGSLASGYADFPLALYIAGSGIYLHRWLREGHRADAIGAALFAAGAAWTKNEGLQFAVLFAVAAGIIAARRHTPWGARRTAFAMAAAVLLVLLPWRVFLRTLPPWISDYELGDFSPAVLRANHARLPLLVSRYARELANPAHWLVLWPALAAGTFAARRRLSFADGMLGALIIAQLAGYFVIHCIARTDPAWYLSASLRRLVLHVAPLGVALLGALAVRFETAGRRPR